MVWGENNNDKNKDKPHNKSPWSHNNQNIDEVLKESQKKIRDFINKSNGNKGGSGNGNNSGNNIKFPSGFLYFIIVVLIGLWLASGFYILQEDEQAIVMRFGEHVRTAGPGPNYHIPFPIEEAIKHNVTTHRIEEFGYRGSQQDPFRIRKADIRNIPEESLMLTGDENIVDINFMVKWKIDDLKSFVFNVQNQRETIRAAAESAVREVIGRTAFVDAQTMGRSRVELESASLLQSILNSYESGVKIISLQMLKVDPPQQVIDAFRDVQTARADKEREINQAYAYKNDLLPRTRGSATKIEQSAEAYKYEVIAKAKGEASRFNAIYEEYKRAKDIVRDRMYIETIEEVLKDLDKTIIDPNMKNFLPHLQMNKQKPGK